MKIPTSLKIEASILGAMLVNKLGYYIATSQQPLQEEDFTTPFNKLVFSIIQKIASSSGAIDLLTVGTELVNQGGDIFQLSQLTENVASTANLEYHVQLLKQTTIRRKLMTSSYETAQASADDSNDVFDLIEKAQRDVLSITEGLKSGEDNAQDILKDISDIALNLKPYERFFVSSGIQSLEESGLYGIETNDIFIIGADAGVGKTAFALNLAIQFLEQKKHIAFFSYEMSSKDLLTRIISIKTGLSMREIQQGNLIEPDKQIFLSVQSWINERLQYFHCFDCAGLSVEGLRAKALSIHYQTGVEAIFIDYVQLIAAPAGMYDANQKQEYNVIKLQHLKKQIGCALVALSQLRKTKTTDRPTASDLKGAQVLEATATKIILLDSKHKRGQLQYEDGTPTLGKIDVYCDKNRNGCLFSVRLNYTGYCYKFADEQQAIFNENFENLGKSAPF